MPNRKPTPPPPSLRAIRSRILALAAQAEEFADFPEDLNPGEHRAHLHYAKRLRAILK